MLLWPASALAAGIELPPRPGEFWLRMDDLDRPAAESAAPTAELRFDSLAALTEHALRTRSESRAAWFSIQAEADRLDAAQAERWPTLTGQLVFTSSRTLSNSGDTGPAVERYGPALGLNYVLYDFGARAAGIEAQRFQLVASLLGSNRALQDIIAEVESGYYALLATQAQLDAVLELEKSVRASLDAAEVRLRAGLASRADQLRARAALAETQLARQGVERDQAKAEAALRRAAGIPQTQALVLAWKPDSPSALDASVMLADLLAEAERQRPDLQSLRAVAASARAEAERARAERWPRLTLAGSGSRNLFLNDDRDPSTNYALGVNLSFTLFDGGRLAAEARAARRDAERLEAEAGTLREAVALQVAQAYQDVLLAERQREGVAIQFESASESAQAADARYGAGVGSLLELLTAQAALARARQAQAQADSDWLAAFSRLGHALGRLPANVVPGQP